MRLRATIIAAALLISLAGIQSAFAVGYEHYDSSGVPQDRTPVYPQTNKGFYQAAKKASFAEKYPDMLDQFAFFVRDVLSQFGITHHTGH
jgi:FlaG/FlaF family flagellin (archaellin)